MVNIRLALIGKRPKLTLPERSPRPALPRPAQQREVISPMRASRSPARSMRARRSAPAQIAGPALIQEHGTTTVLFEQDSCMVASSGELIITVGGADDERLRCADVSDAMPAPQSPPPLAGEGQGGGSPISGVRQCSPLPNPPPPRKRGREQRCGKV